MSTTTPRRHTGSARSSRWASRSISASSLVEATYGVIGHSVALLADAGHNLGDVLGLAIAWGASAAGARADRSHRYTYGLRSSSILAALFNAIVLLIAVGAIAVEAINRFGAPQPVATGTVMVVAAIGIVVNGATALLFGAGRTRRPQRPRAPSCTWPPMPACRSASCSPARSSSRPAGCGSTRRRASSSRLIIVVGTWRLLRDAVNMALDAVPAAHRSGGGARPSRRRSPGSAPSTICTSGR